MRFIATWVTVEAKSMIVVADNLIEANKIFADTNRAAEFQTIEIRHEYEIKELKHDE